jgi:molecular chaperone Hsp33
MGPADLHAQPGNDCLLRALFRDAPVRAQVVHLRDAWRRIVAQHGYPEPVARVLGEMTAAATLLASNIKFAGRLILQIHGDGPVRLLVVECQDDLTVRATAKLREGAVIEPEADLRALVNVGGAGRCAITLDPHDARPGQLPYQGIVALEGDSIASALQGYMRQSEQLETRLWLAADDATAAGVLLQRLPREGGSADDGDTDAWDRANALAGTLTAEELKTVPSAQLMRRLFWQETLDYYAPLIPRFGCRCSRERIGRMLQSLGQAEVDTIVAELGEVTVDCDFCSSRYRFDAIDVALLFASGSTAPAQSERPH